MNYAFESKPKLAYLMFMVTHDHGVPSYTHQINGGVYWRNVPAGAYNIYSCC